MDKYYYYIIGTLVAAAVTIIPKVLPLFFLRGKTFNKKLMTFFKIVPFTSMTVLILREVLVAESSAKLMYIITIGDNAQIHLEAGREADGIFLADELGQPFFQFEVNIECAVEEPGAGTARTVLLCSFDNYLLDFRVVRQSKICIGAEHEDFPTIDNDLGVLITFDFSEIRVNTCGLCLLRLGILSQFIL